MENRKLLFLGALLCFVSLLGAQEYYVDKTDGETRFVQRLVWQADPNASRYEVVIEKFISFEKPPQSVGMFEGDTSLEPGELIDVDELLAGGDVSEGDVSPEGDAAPAGDAALAGDTAPAGDTAEKAAAEEEPEERGIYTGFLRKSVETAFIEVSLPPGIYRYQVTAYDFLDRPGIASEWGRLRIFEALEPTLLGFSPPAFHVDGDGPWTLNLTGENISADAEVYLESEKGRVIVPREYTGNEFLSGARLEFDIKKLVPGNYQIHLENPGGLNASAGTFEIGFVRSYDMFIGAAYAPLIPLYGDLGEMERKPIFPAGASVRFGIFPFKKAYGHFGVEVNATWNHLASVIEEEDVSYHVVGGEINLLYQKWLPNRIMAFTIRVGGGLAGATDLLLPRVELGFSFLWLIYKPLYMEIGVDGMHWFTDGNPGYLRPWLGLGVKL